MEKMVPSLRDGNCGCAKQLKVVVSHPARQVNIYYRPRAAEQMGADVTFLTGLYYRPDRLPYALVRYLPSERRMRVEYELEKRRLEGLSPENVISLLGPMLEATFRPLGKTRQWWAMHDWLASRWIRRRRDVFRNCAAILHSFQGSCRLALRAACEAKMVRLFEVTLPPAPATPEFAGASETDFLNLKEESRDAEFVLVQSEYSARAVASIGVAPDRIIRCHLGVDTDYFRPPEGPRKPGPLRVAFLGGSSVRKGIHHLLEAWSGLDLDGAELLLAGNRTAGLNEIPETPRCRILGRLPDHEFRQFLQDADVLVHPSLAEGGCNVVYEALACGVPAIVSTNATSAVRPDLDGLVFPAGNIIALKLALRRLCCNSELRRKMGMAARQRAESLRWDRYLANLGRIYGALGDYARTGREDALQPVMTGF
jgi:glycosyltransferase involved in cell wall biosynthesis